MSPENDHKYTLPSFNFSEIYSTMDACVCFLFIRPTKNTTVISNPLIGKIFHWAQILRSRHGKVN